MRNRQSPAWYEGMTLDPHHFQQWDRSHRHDLNMRSRAIHPFDWGFVSLDLDRETLTNGQLNVRVCRGITQDGLAFDCPGTHQLPQPQGVKEHFSPSGDRLKVFLALPAEQSSGRNFSAAGSGENRQARFVTRTVPVSDENTGSDERDISVAEPNFRIACGDEPRDDFSLLPIAEVVRTADGTYSLSDKFIPPSLAISASENLMRILRGILELLTAKSDALSDRRRQQPTGQIEYTTVDVTLLGLLHIINGFIPVLRYHFTLGKCHPETLYLTLATLTGQLMTYSHDHDMRPADVPLYDHGNPGECFAILEGRIGRLLDTVLSSNFLRIPMEKQTESQWLGKIPDHGLMVSAQFDLAASGEMPERKLIDVLPMRIKVGGPEDVPTLIAAALPGLPVTHTARPPVGLPTRPDLQYFRLEKSGRLWDSIMRNNSVSVFIPADFKGMRFELIAIKAG